MSRYAVLDLEMCRVPKGEKRKAFGNGNELIQIGAVLLDDNLEIADTFMTLVRPEFGYVDTYIERLTGISAEDVSNAPTADVALKMFIDWLPEDALIVSWSENDLIQIQNELKGKNINLPEFDGYIESWIDCQKTFAQKMDNLRNYSLSEALNITAIGYDDGEHDALVDAKNTARLFVKMEKESELQLSPYIVSEEQQTLCYNPFAELLKMTIA